MLRDSRFHYPSLCHHKEQTISSSHLRCSALPFKGFSPTHLGRTPIAVSHGLANHLFYVEDWHQDSRWAFRAMRGFVADYLLRDVPAVHRGPFRCRHLKPFHLLFLVIFNQGLFHISPFMPPLAAAISAREYSCPINFFGTSFVIKYFL